MSVMDFKGKAWQTGVSETAFPDKQSIPPTHQDTPIHREGSLFPGSVFVTVFRGLNSWISLLCPAK